jgi:RNA polymerase sigma-70 factor (ECF subfamily)
MTPFAPTLSTPKLSTSAESDAESGWVLAAAAGDSRAFEKLYRAHSPRIYGLCLRMTGGDHGAAEDCLQEAFLAAWRALPGFAAQAGFATWLHRIAVNAVLMRARRQRARPEAPLPVDEENEPLEFGEAIEQLPALDVEAALASLPTGARHVVVLHALYGYSHEETAALLEVAVGTCKAQLHRARGLLRARLQLNGA